MWQRLLITGDPITDKLIVTHVDDVLLPLVTPRQPASRTLDATGSS